MCKWLAAMSQLNVCDCVKITEFDSFASSTREKNNCSTNRKSHINEIEKNHIDCELLFQLNRNIKSILIVFFPSFIVTVRFFRLLLHSIVWKIWLLNRALPFHRKCNFYFIFRHFISLRLFFFFSLSLIGFVSLILLFASFSWIIYFRIRSKCLKFNSFQRKIINFICLLSVQFVQFSVALHFVNSSVASCWPIDFLFLLWNSTKMCLW